jgi:hypothetical protein
MPHDIIDNPIRELSSEINNFLADSIRTLFAHLRLILATLPKP